MSSTETVSEKGDLITTPDLNSLPNLHPPLPPNPQPPVANTVEELSTAGLSSTEFEEMLKAKVALGLKLDRGLIADNRDRLLPVDVVEARSTVKYLDDGF